MKILVIGGTYFLGRTFVEQVCKNNKYKDYRLYLLNRGSRPIGIQTSEEALLCVAGEYHMDRHDTERLSGLPEKEFDVVIDFCAYSSNDIRQIIDALGGNIGQYIFISTCDVYRRGTGGVTDESGLLEDRHFDGEAGEYIAGKVSLEKELLSCCGDYGIRYTSFRPAFIYGPYNYAPREGIFFNWIVQAGQIIFPYDAQGEFQMVYVKDLAEILLAACGEPLAYEKVYNVCGEARLNYESFAEILKKASGTDFERVKLSVEDIQKRGIALPFPLTRAETELYSGERVKELGISFTPIEKGMADTFKWYINS
ncbi:MAG: NAD-dependent epimerase/dehydratase family protein [Lachnospiraceae bacterium]|nr:NAD-dependent epimerase/dehydratase family protein [Lachnospiraceae bacterium]